MSEELPRSRVVLRRLPVTLAVLLVVVGVSAALVYIAAGFGSGQVPVTLVNDLGRAVEIGRCVEATCRSGARSSIHRVEPRQARVEAVDRKPGVASFLVTAPSGARIGCLFLRYRQLPQKKSSTVPLSSARRC